ncbi:hypothetical protein ACLOJK_033767 [Asimina triloba]
MPLILSPPPLPTFHAQPPLQLSAAAAEQVGEEKDAVVPIKDTFSPFISTTHSAKAKLEWLRSQIIGANAEFDSPFGRRRITYVDHTASGRSLRAVEDFLQTLVLPFYGNTHTTDSYVGLHTTQLVQESCQFIKHCMGAGPHDVLLFCGTGSTAAVKRLQEVMGVAVPSVIRPRVLDCLAPSERWVVFTGPYEHHSNLLSWRQSLAQVVDIPLSDAGRLDLASLAAALESPEFSGRPKLGSFSACSNVTGIYTDTRAVARLLHEHGAFACFDLACRNCFLNPKRTNTNRGWLGLLHHSAPYVDIDMRSEEMDGYDAVFLSPHKFIGGPGSPGILLMSDALYRLKDAPPSTSGGGTVRYVNGYSDQPRDGLMLLTRVGCVKDTIYCEDVEEREDAGTPGIVQKIRAAMAFRVKQEVGLDVIRAQERLLMGRAMERLRKNPKVHVLGGSTCGAEEEEDRQPIISFLLYPEPDGRGGKPLHCRFVTKFLNDAFGIQARGGCACAGPYGHALLGIDRDHARAIRAAIAKGYEGVKPGWTRVSLSYYTSVEEMEYVVEAIEFAAAHAHRFLPLYQFDWRTGDWRFAAAAPNKVHLPIIPNFFLKNNPQNMNIIREEQGVSNEYEYMRDYMEEAKRIADLLPDYPHQQHHSSSSSSCPPPPAIHPCLITFRI